MSLDGEWDRVWVGARLATLVAGGAPYGEVPEDALAVKGDRIAWIGSSAEARRRAGVARVPVEECAGLWLTPGLIDCHTHLVYGGNRVAEFEKRLCGVPYEEIARAGGGIYLKYGNPMLLDDLCVDFPDMPIIMAHPSFPWQEEALSVATHKPNVYIDLSGWSPKYFPPILVRYINSILQDKMLFGSDWPVITPDRWMADFAKLEIRDEIRPKVLKANARKLLGI